jgi:ribosomal-protein-alanine N-acetyltransferase
MALLDWMTDATGPHVRGEGAWPEDDLSRAAFRRRLSVYGREMELGNAYPFFIFDSGERVLLGAVTLSNIRRGVAETGTLGYWIGQPYAGAGHATDAVRAVARHAFEALRLHRLEASCLPTNKASRRVLEKAGFRKEGEARAYLKINGVWAVVG